MTSHMLCCLFICKNVLVRESQQAKSLPKRLSGVLIHARRAIVSSIVTHRERRSIAVARARTETFVTRRISGLHSNQTERTKKFCSMSHPPFRSTHNSQQITKTCSSNFQRYGFREYLGMLCIVRNQSVHFIFIAHRFLRCTLSRVSSFLTTMAIEFSPK